MNIVDAYGNRWDKEEWLAMGQSEQAWETIVLLTSAIRKADDGLGTAEGVGLLTYMDIDSPETKIVAAILATDHKT